MLDLNERYCEIAAKRLPAKSCSTSNGTNRVTVTDRNCESVHGPYPYYADWIDDPKLPHGGVYAVRCATAVICRTGPYKKGWEEAQTIAAAMNEKARSDLPPNPWSREDVQRVLYHIVRSYEVAHQHLGGDSEILRDAIRIGRQTLKDNNWWPHESDIS